VINRK